MEADGEISAIRTDKGSDSPRAKINDMTVALACAEASRVLQDKIREKGSGTFASRHEILGLLEEEHFELIQAVRSESLERVKEELYDIAVVCLFGAACINAGTVEW